MPAERPLSEEVLERIAAEVIRPVMFIFADFPSGARRIWTGVGSIVFKSETWEGVGGAIEFSAFQETTDTTVQGITAKLNALDPVTAAAISQDSYQGRRCEIWLAFFDEDEDALYPMDAPLWAGSMDCDEVEDSGTAASLLIRAEHEISDILRKREYRYTHRDQQAMYPDAEDTGLDKIERIQDVTSPWGRAGA